MTKESTNGIRLNRREALKLSAAAGMGIALAEHAHASDSIKTGVHQEPGNCSTPRSAVANTQYGKVRGFLDGGVFTFKGIPYGQDTGGENRWLPAKPPAPWTDEYPALIYGANCPQNLHPWIADGLHMSTHAGALLLAALAYMFARRYAQDERFTFGTGKLGDLAGFTSAIILAMIALLIGYEAVSRLFEPVAIHFAEAIPIAGLGLAVNIASAGS